MKNKLSTVFLRNSTDLVAMCFTVGGSEEKAKEGDNNVEVHKSCSFLRLGLKGDEAD